MSVKIFQIMLILIFWSVCSGRAQQAPANQEWAAKVWEGLLDSLAVKIPAQADTLGLLVADGANGKKMVLENAFARHFSTSGKQITLQRRGASIIVQTVDFRARYRPIASSWLGFSRKYERRLSLRLRGWLENNPGRTILLSFNSRRAQTDTLSSKDIEINDQKAYPAFRGTWQSYSFWSKFLEPGVVLLSSVTVIYLFFSMRS